MNIIVDNGETRQMQPKDQKFLSDANLEIVKAFGGAMLTMFGYSEGDCVVLSGLNINGTSAPNYAVSEGYVFWNKNLYYIPSCTVTAVSFPSLIQRLMLSLPTNPVLVAPSPVRDENLDLVVNVHYDYRGLAGEYLAGDNLFGFDSSNLAFPTMKRLGEFQRVIVPTGD